MLFFAFPFLHSLQATSSTKTKLNKIRSRSSCSVLTDLGPSNNTNHDVSVSLHTGRSCSETRANSLPRYSIKSCLSWTVWWPYWSALVMYLVPIRFDAKQFETSIDTMTGRKQHLRYDLIVRRDSNLRTFRRDLLQFMSS